MARRRRRVGISDRVVIVNVGVDATESGPSKISTVCPVERG